MRLAKETRRLKVWNGWFGLCDFLLKNSMLFTETHLAPCFISQRIIVHECCLFRVVVNLHSDNKLC